MKASEQTYQIFDEIAVRPICAHERVWSTFDTGRHIMVSIVANDDTLICALGGKFDGTTRVFAALHAFFTVLGMHRKRRWAHSTTTIVPRIFLSLSE